MSNISEAGRVPAGANSLLRARGFNISAKRVRRTRQLTTDHPDSNLSRVGTPTPSQTLSGITLPRISLEPSH